VPRRERLNESGSGDGQRLLFLGAGFSRAAGLPLANELLDLALAEIRRHFPEATKLDKSLDRYRHFVADTTSASARALDIEQFCAYLDHEHVLGLRGSDTWSDEGNEDQLMLRWGIGAALARATPPVPDLPSHYLEFAKRLRPMDCVVTFNYDRLLEDTLDAVGTPYRRFPSRYTSCHDMHSVVDHERDACEVRILKVHGSIDWVDRSGFERDLRILARQDADASFRRRHLIFGDTPITGSRPLVEGPRPEDDPLASVMVLDDLGAYYGNPNAWHYAAPLILAPSTAKLLYGAPMREFWRGMPGAAWAWSGLGIVGYSLPPADPYALQVLWSIGTAYGSTFDDADWSLHPKRRIKVVDYRTTSDDAGALRKTYSFLESSITDYFLDGFDDGTVHELLGE
jgi:hypothetical protein